MVPDIKLRLYSVVNSLDQCISHSIPKDQQLAHSQLGLIRNTINLIIKQLDFEVGVLLKDIGNHLSLIDQLLAVLAEDNEWRPLLIELKNKAVPCVSEPRASRASLDTLHFELARELEKVTDSLAAKRSSSDYQKVFDAILQHSKVQAYLYRAWMADCGFDPEKDNLPSFEEITGSV